MDQDNSLKSRIISLGPKNANNPQTDYIDELKKIGEDEKNKIRSSNFAFDNNRYESMDLNAEKRWVEENQAQPNFRNSRKDFGSIFKQMKNNSNLKSDIEDTVKYNSIDVEILGSEEDFFAKNYDEFLQSNGEKIDALCEGYLV